MVEGQRYLFKLVILGDGGVGKTSLAVRMVSGAFSETIRMTIGLEVHVKELQVGGSRVTLQVWDFGGEERFRFLLPRYCAQADGALFLYDVTDPATLLHLRNWMEVASANTRPIPVLCIGSKIDLVEQRKVTRDEAIQLARTFHLAGYAEVSAKTGQDVEGVFEAITKLMMERKRKGKDAPTSSI